MPGLNQLKQFNEFMLNLGDEVRIRQDRGEKPSLIAIPANVEDRDDSEDFINGLPQLSEEEQQQAEARAAEAERSKNDFSDFTGEGESEDVSSPEAVEIKAPDLSDLLTPNPDLSLGDIDLSDFEEVEKPKEPPKPKVVAIEDMDLDALLKSGPKKTETKKEAPKTEAKVSSSKTSGLSKAPSAKASSPKESPASLAKDSSSKVASAMSKSHEAKESAAPKSGGKKEVIENLNTITPFQDDDFSSQNGDFDFSNANSDFEKVSQAAAINMNDLLPPELNEVPGNESLEKGISKADEEKNPLLNDDFVLPDFDPHAKTSREKNEEEFGIKSAIKKNPSKKDEASFDLTSSDQEGENSSFDSASDFTEDFSAAMPDFSGTDISTADQNDFSTDQKTDDFSTDDFAQNNSDDFSAEDFSDSGINDVDFSDSDFENPSDKNSLENPENEKDDFSASGGDFDFDTNPSGEDFTSDFSDDFSSEEDVNPEASVPDSDSTEDENFEQFDTSSMEGLDFSSDTGDDSSDFEFGNISDTESDDDDVFSIPGFSDTSTADFNAAKANVQTPDFSGAVEGDSAPKNTFTDAQYKKFLKNLESYPLNVRIAIEDLVVKNEFTDDAVFSILEKVYKKVPARQIASDLEKMLDITLEVPRDFERRSAEEYEAYKKSLEYQLKNRILPGTIVSAAAAILLFCIFTISNSFIIKPLKANRLYKQGYTLLEESQYPQSLEKFNAALAFKVKKPWFYKYARGFRNHRQYQRAINMYSAILSYFDHEKEAGLEWAEMEMNDLYDYEEAERVLRREVLDYHINDPDALLMLGDNFLEWASEKDSSKFQDAKEQYDLLLEKGDEKFYSLYLSRQMRYYIRTDNLREVLQYKAYFYPIQKKDGLTAKDLTELSGYLLDKQFGTLKPSEENLRFEIENVRELLEKALQADESNPIALYNLGRYFVETNSSSSALSLLSESINQFKNQDRRSKSETYKFINAYRLLGEEYKNEKEYILAEETYGKGLELYEKENDESGFESDSNVGKLYADLADLDYFISGDMDSALLNYQKAVENKNDNASTRYRIGYIYYTQEDYQKAMWSFLKSRDFNSNDTHLLLALANTFSQSDDNYNALGYYDLLLNKLDSLKEQYGVLLPQVKTEHADLVETYMRASNNDGVTLARIAQMTGDSSMNGKALARLQESLRAWDALTRNQETLVRLEGSNLAEQNIRYLTNPSSEYDVEIYPYIFKLMLNEDGI